MVAIIHRFISFSINPTVKGKVSNFRVPVCIKPLVIYHCYKTSFSSIIPINIFLPPTSFALLQAKSNKDLPYPNGCKLNIFLEVGNTEVIKKFVAANLGLSLLPQFTILEELECGQIKILDVSDFKIKMHGQIFYHKNKWLTSSIKEFIRIVEDIL
jgi:hypothetical protein